MNKKLQLPAAALATVLGLLITVPANAQLVEINWPTPTSPYEQAALALQKRITDHYEAGYLTDLEFAMYDQEIYAAMDACMWRRMRNVSDAINSKRTMKKLRLIEDQYNFSTQMRRK